MADEKQFQRAKDLLENFNRIDEQVQDKLLLGVKSMAFIFDATQNIKDDENNVVPLQAVS